MRDWVKKGLGLFLFGLAMGLMEAVIVVYLRELYYPEGFGFPLHDMPDRMVFFEWIREACTLAMLVSLAWVSGKNRIERFAFFLFSFAVWDIFYYVGLKAFLNWPGSLLTWDVLFLIPVPWLSPVLAPVICSIGMIGLAVEWIWLQETRHFLRLTWKEQTLLLSGAILVFWTFIEDFSRLMLNRGQPETADLKSAVACFVPGEYNWGLFFAGIVLILLAAVRLSFRLRRDK